MKHVIPLCLALLLLLSACGGAAPESDQTTPSEDVEGQATEAVVETESSTESPETEALSDPAKETSPTEETESTSTESSTEETTTGAVAMATDASCHAESITSLIDLQVAEGIPAVTSADWQHGGGEEAITVVEYGDFQ